MEIQWNGPSLEFEQQSGMPSQAVPGLENWTCLAGKGQANSLLFIGIVFAL